MLAVCRAACLLLLTHCSILAAQEKTAAPEKPQQRSAVPADINKNFLDPNLDPNAWVARFEIESREVFACRKAILNAVALPPGGSIADVGCGTGMYVGPFSQLAGETGKVYAVDISPKLVDFVAQRIHKEHLGNVQVVLSKEDSTELPAASVDRVFVCDTYHHFEFHLAMLQSIHEALRPGGMLIVVDFDRVPGQSRDWILEHVRAGKDQVRREIELAGFRFKDEVKIDGFQENYLLRFMR